MEPGKGIFILKSLHHYPKDIDIEVIAPVPFFLGMRRKKTGVIPFVRHEKQGERRIRIWHPRFILLPGNILRAFVPLFEYLAVIPIVWAIHKSKKIDSLHANFCLPDGIAVYKISKTLGIPYLITEHHGVVDKLLSKRYLRNMMIPAYNSAHKVVAVSDRIRDVMTGFGVPQSKVVTIPNGIALDDFMPSFDDRKIHKLIYIGNLIHSKGIHVLLEALAKIDDTIMLSIVGDGNYKARLHSLARKLDLKDRVTFHGAKAPHEVAKLLAEHDALVHPSFCESFGLVVVEAMASGLPVVATINGGSENIVTAETGILVPADDASLLAEGIRSLILADWDRTYIASFAKEHYDIQSVIAQTLAEYPSPKKEHRICHLSSVHMRTDVRVFFKQCVSLHNAGFKVHLVVADGKRHERKAGVIIHDVGSSDNRFTRIISAPLRILRKALYISADAYQIHDPELLPVAVLLKMITRKPVVYDIHESYGALMLHKEYLSKIKGFILSKLISIVEKTALKILDQGIAATEHISEDFNNIPIIHNYPLLKEWTGIEDDPTRYTSRNICYIGNINRERGITQIVKAIENVDCRFHLAGNYDPPSYRDELLTMPGFAKVVEYGYVNRDQAADIFAKSALGLMLIDKKPNNLYALSTKIFEYMAAGLPIMVSDLHTNIKLLDSSPAGIYLDPQNMDLITEKLDALLSDSALLQKMGQVGKNLVQNKLSWEAEEEAYIKIFKDLLQMELN